MTLVRSTGKGFFDASMEVFYGSFLTLSKAKFSVTQGNSRPLSHSGQRPSAGGEGGVWGTHTCRIPS